MIVRVFLALDAPLLDPLMGGLRSPQVVVDQVDPAEDVWTRVGSETGDLLVLGRARLPEPPDDLVAMLADLPERPWVVVVCPEDDPEERARLLSAGCETVLYAGLSVAQLLAVLQALVRRRRELARAGRGAQRLQAEPSLNDFVSTSPTMQAFIGVVRRVARSEVTLLIEGETGVGKERLARALHRDGPRGRGPFVAVNCGALPESLLESELFGHEKGAFTGATRSRRGCFELADGGTLFLDEVGEIPFHLQVKLLRALQEREVQRVGGERPLPVDVRVMAATNRDLAAEVEAGGFRRDLLYRLNVVTLTIPPLRERVEDIPELVADYIDYLRPRIGCEVYEIADDALDALCRYGWPGNVRELINVLERAMLLCDGDRLTQLDLPAGVAGAGRPVMAGLVAVGVPGAMGLPEELLALPLPVARRRVIEAFERAYLEAHLERAGGRVGETARRVGIKPRSLFDRMKQLGLDKEDFRG